MTLTVNWELTDAEYAALQRLVAAEGTNEAVDEYAARVGLKGLKGQIEARVDALRKRSIETLNTAWNAASAPAKVSALAALGYELLPDGRIQPITPPV